MWECMKELPQGPVHPCCEEGGLRKSPGLGAIVLTQRGRLFHAARSYEEVHKMPTFSIVSLREAREGSASGKRAELL